MMFINIRMYMAVNKVFANKYNVLYQVYVIWCRISSYKKQHFITVMFLHRILPFAMVGRMSAGT